jgi:hypothetical protein
MLRLGKGCGRDSVRKSLERGTPLVVMYEDVLEAGDIREAVAGIRDAGSPKEASVVLAWLASHPNSPEDVLWDLETHGGREVLLSLALNPKLPADLRKALLEHTDDDVREHAHHVFSRSKR